MATLQRVETLAVHAGQTPDPTTNARAVPIYASTSFVRAPARSGVQRAQGGARSSCKTRRAPSSLRFGRTTAGLWPPDAPPPRCGINLLRLCVRLCFWATL